MKLSLRTDRHTDNTVIRALEECASQAVNHAVDKYSVRIRCVHLLRPSTALIILWRIPEGANAGLHEEEHARLPDILRDTIDQTPELCDGGDLVDLDVAFQTVVIVRGVVIPESPRHFVRGHLLVEKEVIRFPERKKNVIYLLW